MSERTLALSQLKKLADPKSGHDERLPMICDTFAPYLAEGLRIVGAFGVVNVDRAAEIAVTTGTGPLKRYEPGPPMTIHTHSGG